jgi:CRP-like cAMP-binding protein
MNPKEKELFYNYFKNFSLYGEGEVDGFIDYFECVEIEKDKILQEKGRPNEFTYLVIEGCLITYSYKANGDLVVLDIIPENNWVTGGTMYTIEGIYIKSVESTKLFRADTNALENLKLKNNNNYKEIIALREALKALQLRLLNNLTKPAVYNYQELLKRFPNIEQRLSQKYLASYLGVTPQFFSKMRTEYLASKH